MNEFLISGLDVACIINNFDLTENFSAELIRRLWINEKNFLQPEYRQNYHKWFFNVRYWSNYCYDKMTFDKEFPAIQKDCGGSLAEKNFVTDNFNLDLFFKSLRIKILYIGEKNYSRLKLRTLLSVYGYKRRSKEFIARVKRCLDFYRLQSSFHGEVCDIAEINLDAMITFRVV